MSGQPDNQLKFFRIPDLIIIVVLIFFSAVSFSYFSGVSGNTAVLYVNNKKHASFQLESKATDKILSVGNTHFKLEYGDGRIRVVESPCYHKICVRQGYIQKTDKQIICVPYKLLVRIEINNKVDESESSTDAITF